MPQFNNWTYTSNQIPLYSTHSLMSHLQVFKLCVISKKTLWELSQLVITESPACKKTPSILYSLTVSVCLSVMDVMHFPSVPYQCVHSEHYSDVARLQRYCFRIQWILMSSYLAGCGICALTSGEGRGDALWGLSLTLPSQISQTQ